MSAAVDYIADAETRGPGALGVPEQIELDAAITCGEYGAAVIAERMGISSRSVDRRRAELIKRGVRCRVPEASDGWRPEWTPRGCCLGDP